MRARCRTGVLPAVVNHEARDPLMPASLSKDVLVLFREPSYAQLVTLMPDGSPQVTQVWIKTDGGHIITNARAPRAAERYWRLGLRPCHGSS